MPVYRSMSIGKSIPLKSSEHREVAHLSMIDYAVDKSSISGEIEIRIVVAEIIDPSYDGIVHIPLDVVGVEGSIQFRADMSKMLIETGFRFKGELFPF